MTSFCLCLLIYVSKYLNINHAYPLIDMLIAMNIVLSGIFTKIYSFNFFPSTFISTQKKGTTSNSAYKVF